MTAYPIDGQLGIDVTAAPVTTPGFKVGTRVRLSDGTEWVYLEASATIPAYAACAITNSSTCAGLTSTLGLQGKAIVIAQQAYSASQYGWFLMTNPLAATAYKVRVAASAAVDAKLATTAYAGTLDDTTAGTVLRVDGIALTDSQPSGSSGSRTFRTSNFPLGWGAV